MKINRPTCYIIKRKNGSTWKIFYLKDIGICYEVFENEAWSDKKVISKDARNNFRIILDEDDTIYIIYEDNTGDILLTSFKEDISNETVFLHRKAESQYPLQFNVLMINKDINMFYNIPNRTGYNEALVHQIAHNGTEWSSPKLVDVVKPQGVNPLAVLKDDNNNIYLFYNNQNESLNLGYKRYDTLNNSWGNFTIIDTSSSSYLDYSFIVEKEVVYTLFIKKDAFTYSLFYKKADQSSSKALRLFENFKLSSCSLFVIDGHLHAFWVCDGLLYGSYSTDYGSSFSKPSLYGNNSNARLQKAVYFWNYHDKQRHSFSGELFINIDEAGNIELIKDLIPDSININSKAFEDAFELNPENIDIHLKHIKNHLNEAYEKIYYFKRQLRERDQQILQLRNTLENKNMELLNANYGLLKLKESYEHKSNESLSLQDKNKILEQRIKIVEQKLVLKQEELNTLQDDNGALKNEMVALREHIESSSQEQINSSQTHKRGKASILKWIFDDDGSKY